MKKIVTILVAAVLLASMLMLGGCGGGKLKMVTGRWKLATVGSGNGGNQQQYYLPLSVDIYPNGTLNMFDDPFGKWTMDRDTFTFKSDDGEMNVTGSFKIDFVEDESTGSTIPQLTVYPDDVDASYVLTKVADLGPLESALRASAAAQSAAPAATQAAK